jgi:hypothetical protein
MQASIHDHVPMNVVSSQIPLAKGMVWGFLGGLVATLVMDLVLMSSLVAAGGSALTCFSIVGDTVTRLFSLKVTAGIPLGIAVHYTVGPLMGIIFGALAARNYAVAKRSAGKWNFLRIDSRKKMILLAVLYAEIFSMPLVTLSPILMKMPVSDTLLWFGGAVVMHLIWACVLGVVMSMGLRMPVTAQSD